MTCCHRDDTAEQFDAAIAGRDLRRYRRHGPDAPTRRLLEAVQQYPLPRAATLLDIGGGIGAIHHHLLDHGFDRVVHVDAFPAYLAVAADEARRLGHAERVRFHQGAFPADGGGVPPADLVTLDRVVCCDPDYVRLLGAAAQCARRLLAFSYPRSRWVIRQVVAASNVLRRWRGSAFRVFVHPPERMKAVLEGAGMREVWTGGTWIWAVKVFERAA